MDILSLCICEAPQMEACEYMGQPFYQGVNTIVKAFCEGLVAIVHSNLLTLPPNSYLTLLDF